MMALALLLPGTAQAQDEIDCTPDELRPWLENYLGWRNAASEVFSPDQVNDDPLAFLFALHDFQARMDAPGRPDCADALVFETYRSFHWAEYALLCLRYSATGCLQFMGASEEAADVDDILKDYIIAAGLTEADIESLWPEGWNAEAYRAAIGISSAAAIDDEVEIDSASARGTRSNPYPTGEWVSFSEGRVRVMPVNNDYQSSFGFSPPPDARYIAIPIEWECYQPDPNAICQGRLWSMYVTPDGLIIDHAPVYESPLFGSTETQGYSGALLKGNVYFQIPRTSELGQLRLELDRQHVFFELTAAQ